MMLPHVVRWNRASVGDRYAELLTASGTNPSGAREAAALKLADRLVTLARSGGLPASLGDLGVSRNELPALAVA